jgi:1A family penicillin-binding protein
LPCKSGEMSDRGRTFIRIALIVFIDLVVLIPALVILWALLDLPRIPSDLDALSSQTGVNIYADSGELLYTFNKSVEQITLQEISPWFVQAVLATEDLEFYNHHGISLKGIAGAVLDNLRHFRKVRGGSTITQQIVKNTMLTREKTFSRKIKEALLALQLESMYKLQYGPKAKMKLLELYVNGSFFGTNAYGVEDAAQVYFGKRAANLTLRESAVLAGLPNAPSALNPLRRSGTQVAKRTRHVLRRMVNAGYITDTEYREAMQDSLVFSGKRRTQNRTPYFVETIKEEIARRWGRSALSFGALNIRTTLDLRMQQAAERAITSGLSELDQRLGFKPYEKATRSNRNDYVQSALICLDPESGYVKAMVGGRDIFVSYYNRATTARRQPGSGFKPIVYLTGIASRQVSPVSLFMDGPRTYRVNGRNWTPRNFKDQYLGETTAAWALTKSANSTSVQIVQRVGPERVVEMARRLGIHSTLGPYPSIALGASDVTLLELATAYGTIANYGIRVEPTFVKSIEEPGGRVLYRHTVQPVPAVSPSDAYIIIQMMQNVVNRGTGRILRRLGYNAPVAGKTGTTNDNTDAWFTGFTPDLVTSVWVGFDSKKAGRKLVGRKTRRQITGGSGAAPIWTTFMKEVNPSTSNQSFWVPPNIKIVEIDAITGEALDSTSTTDSSRVSLTIALDGDRLPNTSRELDAFRKSLLDTLGID